MNAVELLERLPAAVIRRGLEVRWFDTWEPVLDEALAELPEQETCPHELFRMLVEQRGRAPRRAALVLDRGEPIALAGLRRRKWFWEPVAGVSPRPLMPARPGQLYRAAAALGVDLWMGGWEQPPPPEARPHLRQLFPLPVYKAPCGPGAERHWRSAGNMNAAKSARNRTRGFAFEVDAPGAAEWIIQNWAATWSGHPNQETIGADDQIIAARYYMPRGRLHAFRLLHGERPAGGYTAFVFHDTLVLLCTYRDPAYAWHGVGMRLFDLILRWAAAAGFAKVDLGAGHAYKERWAPRDGERWYFNVCPLHLYAAKRVLRALRRALSGAPSPGVG